MKRYLAASIFLLSICACSEDDPPPVSPTGGAGLPSTTSTITAADGGTATSKDALFSVDFAAGSLTQDASVKITEGVASPVPTLTIGKVYNVEVTPAAAVPATMFSADLIFSLTSTILGGHNTADVGVGTGTTGSTTFTVLAGTYDMQDQTFMSSVTHFSTFFMFDMTAYYECACDTSGACDASCNHCDPDCSGCACDVTFSCDPSCDCDTDCDACACDVSMACDVDCECDFDCSGGCTCDSTAGCDCYCDADCGDTGGVYPYSDCSSASCLSGMCVDDFDVFVCVGTCHQSTSSCGAGFACEQGMCVKLCPNGVSDCSGDDCCEDGVCTPAAICSVPPPEGWYCDGSYYSANDGCDCGCGLVDPDCLSGGCAEVGCSDAACEFCYDAQGNGVDCPTTP